MAPFHGSPVPNFPRLGSGRPATAAAKTARAKGRVALGARRRSRSTNNGGGAADCGGSLLPCGPPRTAAGTAAGPMPESVYTGTHVEHHNADTLQQRGLAGVRYSTNNATAVLHRSLYDQACDIVLIARIYFHSRTYLYSFIYIQSFICMYSFIFIYSDFVIYISSLVYLIGYSHLLI